MSSCQVALLPLGLSASDRRETIPAATVPSIDCAMMGKFHTLGQTQRLCGRLADGYTIFFIAENGSPARTIVNLPGEVGANASILNLTGRSN